MLFFCLSVVVECKGLSLALERMLALFVGTSPSGERARALPSRSGALPSDIVELRKSDYIHMLIRLAQLVRLNVVRPGILFVVHCRAGQDFFFDMLLLDVVKLQRALALSRFVWFSLPRFCWTSQSLETTLSLAFNLTLLLHSFGHR